MFKVVSQKGWTKGIVAVQNRFGIAKGAVLKASNLLLSERGALDICDGTLVASALSSAPSGGFLELGQFVDASGNITRLAVGAPTTSTLQLYNWNTNPPTTIGSPMTLATGWTQPQIINFSNGASPTAAGLVIITVGLGVTPYQWDGTTLQQITAQTGSLTWLANHYYQINDRVVAQGNAYQVCSLTINSGGTGSTFGGTIQQGGFSGNSTPGFAGGDTPGTVHDDNQIIWMCIRAGTAAFAKQSVPAGAAHAISHAGALWLWGTSATNTDPNTNNGGADGPNCLRASMLNDPNEWPNQNIAFVGKNDGTAAMGCATFTIAEAGIAPTGSLVLFKDYSGYQVLSVFGASDFSIKQIKSDMGCFAPRTIKFATGFGIIRFCHLGFALFDGVNDRLISEEVRPYIFGRSDISAVDYTRLARGRAALVANPPMYCCALPTKDGNTTRIFCYDLVNKAWCIVDYANGSASYPISAMSQLRFPINGISSPANAITYIADYNSGTGIAAIRRWQQGDVNWDSVNQAPSYSVQFAEIGEPASRAFFRRAVVRCHASSAGSMTAAINVGANALPSNSQNEIGAGPSTGLSTSRVTTATYEGEKDQALSFDIGQTGPSLNLTLSGTSHLTIEGVDIHVVPKAPRPFTKAA